MTAIPQRRTIDGKSYAVRETNGGPGWSVQRHYPEVGRWFDVGPHGLTIEQANERLADLEPEREMIEVPAR